MDNGYIKLYRTLRDNPIMQKPEYLSVWIFLLLSANHRDIDVILNNRKTTIKAGSFITSRPKICANTKVHRSTVERILEYLKNEQQIEQQTFSKYRIISICNWDKYQEGEQVKEHQMSTKRAPNEHQMSTNKNDKNDKNKEKENIIKEKEKCVDKDFLAFYDAYPLKRDKPHTLRTWKKLNGSRPDISLLLAAIEKQKLWRERANPTDFRPEWKHPATWLSKGCWEDEIEVKKAKWD